MLAADGTLASAASLLLVFDEMNSSRPFGGLTLSPCMAVDAFDRLAQLTLAIWLHQAADGDLGCAGVSVSRREQGRHALLLRRMRQVDPGLLARAGARR